MAELILKAKCSACGASNRVDESMVNHFKKCRRCGETFRVESVREVVSKSGSRPTSLQIPWGKAGIFAGFAVIGVVVMLCAGMISRITSLAGGAPSSGPFSEWYAGLQEGIPLGEAKSHLKAMPQHGNVAFNTLLILPYQGEPSTTGKVSFSSENVSEELLYIDGELVGGEHHITLDGVEYVVHTAASNPNPIHDPSGTTCYGSTAKGGDVVVEQETFVDELGRAIRELRWEIRFKAEDSDEIGSAHVKLKFEQKSGQKGLWLSTFSQKGL